MADMFPGQVSAVQVGTFFVGQYYNILQQQPGVVHQFYNDASTMMRIDGDATETATGMVQIHSLIMSLNFTGIEIKTANFLSTWGDGVLVMVSGVVQMREYNARRKFFQTFFLAPQEKGYFVLSDFFHFLDEDQIHQPAISTRDSFENNLNTSNAIPEAASDYLHGGEIHTEEHALPIQAEENGTVAEYFPETQQHVPEPDDSINESLAEEAVPSFANLTITARVPSTIPAAEPVGEPLKHTYASILRTAKGLSQPVFQPSLTFESPQVPQTTPQQITFEEVEDIATQDDDVESKSVYVGNVPSSVSESDLESEFKNFGRIRPDGVAIRSRKDSDGYYAFVEFEDVIGVKNALKASPLQINGWQIYVEERRPNSGASRGGRRGRGRGGYQSEAPRGRFGGRSFGRGDTDREYTSRARGNGLYQRAPRQERGILGN